MEQLEKNAYLDLTYENPYAYLYEKPSEHIISKSRLKKCKKGLHEYSKQEFKEVWVCKHCNTISKLHNLKTFKSE